MKLALALGSLVLVSWPSLHPQLQSVPVARNSAEVRARVLDARKLEVVRSLASGERRSELTLADLPSDARLREVEAAPYMESGVVIGLVIEVGGRFEYRYLCQRQGDEGGSRAV